MHQMCPSRKWKWQRSTEATTAKDEVNIADLTSRRIVEKTPCAQLVLCAFLPMVARQRRTSWREEWCYSSKQTELSIYSHKYTQSWLVRLLETLWRTFSYRLTLQCHWILSFWAVPVLTLYLMFWIWIKSIFRKTSEVPNLGSAIVTTV